MFWLASVSELAQDYTDQFFAFIAIAEFFQALAIKISRTPQPKKPKVKAKDRRRIAREI
jgi:hypothetical protein